MHCEYGGGLCTFLLLTVLKIVVVSCLLCPDVALALGIIAAFTGSKLFWNINDDLRLAKISSALTFARHLEIENLHLSVSVCQNYIIC